MARRKPAPETAPVHRVNVFLRDKQIDVALVGCGGNGSMLLNRLARLDHALRACHHPGLKIFVFDPDVVSESNVGRQCFAPQDVGLSKAVVCVHRVVNFYGTMAFPAQTKYPGCIPSIIGGGTRSSPDILITCVDTAKARREIHKDFKNSPTAPRYWLDLGNDRLDGQVILGQPADCHWNQITTGTIGQEEFVRAGTAGNVMPSQARLPTVVEVFPEILNSRKRESDTPTCSVAEALDRQSLFINDSLTVWAAQILDDLLRIGELHWHGAFLNLATGRVNTKPVPAPAFVRRNKGEWVLAEAN